MGVGFTPFISVFFCFDDIWYEKRKNFKADDGEVMMAQLAERSMAYTIREITGSNPVHCFSFFIDIFFFRAKNSCFLMEKSR